MALNQSLPPGADEIVAADSHVTRILNAHIGLPVSLQVPDDSSHVLHPNRREKPVQPLWLLL